MKTEPEDVILSGDERAAKPHTMTGWLSRDGAFYVDERAARYAGSTHSPCRDCGAVVHKYRTICGVCDDKREAAAYAAMKREVWDGVQMVFSQALDRYFGSPAEALQQAFDDAETEDAAATITMASLRLALCYPVYASPLDSDYWSDSLPGEEGDCPDWLKDLIDAFNELLKDAPVLSWRAGKTASLGLDA